MRLLLGKSAQLAMVILFLFGFVRAIYAQVRQPGTVPLNAMPTIWEERDKCDWQSYRILTNLNAVVDNSPYLGFCLDYRDVIYFTNSALRPREEAWSNSVCIRGKQAILANRRRINKSYDWPPQPTDNPINFHFNVKDDWMTRLISCNEESSQRIVATILFNKYISCDCTAGEYLVETRHGEGRLFASDLRSFPNSSFRPYFFFQTVVERPQVVGGMRVNANFRHSVRTNDRSVVHNSKFSRDSPDGWDSLVTQILGCLAICRHNNSLRNDYDGNDSSQSRFSAKQKCESECSPPMQF